MIHLLDLPPTENSYFSEEIRFELHPALYFVFGSNYQGVHGAGAAKQALEEFGAIRGIGNGIQGMSYAIPTKAYKGGKLRVLPLEVIQNYVDEFLQYNKDNPDKYFFLTAVGTGYAGYKHSQIAPMFKGIQNTWLPEHWRPYLEIK